MFCFIFYFISFLFSVIIISVLSSVKFSRLQAGPDADDHLQGLSLSPPPTPLSHYRGSDATTSWAGGSCIAADRLGPDFL